MDQGVTCSLGDVLRTTPLLHLFKNDHVTWLTDERAADLLPGKPWIDELITYRSDNATQLAGQEFDMVINLECDSRLTDLLSSVSYDAWRGLPLWAVNVLGRRDPVEDIKEGLISTIQKGKTWPEILYQMVGAQYNGEPMILGGVKEVEITHDIGLNYKVGAKWPTKAWPEDYWQELIQGLGGRYTFEFQKHLSDLPGYIEWINHCRVLVTNDSLGMHIAQALGKKTVALFGPTSFETVPQTETIIFLHSKPLLMCQPCYRCECNQSSQCMRNIRVSDVLEAIETLIST